jgi:hypothetical protein
MRNSNCKIEVILKGELWEGQIDRLVKEIADVLKREFLGQLQSGFELHVTFEGWAQ